MQPLVEARPAEEVPAERHNGILWQLEAYVRSNLFPPLPATLLPLVESQKLAAMLDTGRNHDELQWFKIVSIMSNTE